MQIEDNDIIRGAELPFHLDERCVSPPAYSGVTDPKNMVIVDILDTVQGLAFGFYVCSSKDDAASMAIRHMVRG